MDFCSYPPAHLIDFEPQRASRWRDSFEFLILSFEFGGFWLTEDGEYAELQITPRKRKLDWDDLKK